MLNIYGEKVTLTKAQRREYVALLDGPRFVHWQDRGHKVFKALVDKGLVKAPLYIGARDRFERWM